MKMSFSIEIPDWVTHIAQDKDGDWYGYNTKPYVEDICNEWDGDKVIHLARCESPENYTEELFEIIR